MKLDFAILTYPFSRGRGEKAMLRARWWVGVAGIAAIAMVIIQLVVGWGTIIDGRTSEIPIHLTFTNPPRTVNIGADDEITFHVIGKESSLTQKVIVKASSGDEQELVRVGDKIRLGPFTEETKISVAAYASNSKGSVKKSMMRVTTEQNRTWLIQVEDGTDGDYNDISIRVSIVGCGHNCK